MSEYDYNKLPEELLKLEAKRLDEQIDELMYRRQLIAIAIGNKALKRAAVIVPLFDV